MMVNSTATSNEQSICAADLLAPVAVVRLPTMAVSQGLDRTSIFDILLLDTHNITA